ncbi:hypothetical protein [Vibrio aestuarianus]|uniref:Uncharacterized protein n=1 Tax=Vibrio aestuarianus TaxID=28171 RepID=A0ABM9FM02_9VIBR|nr:hypothetical protein [Vibrio aestuarianus]MDE1227769.1 hypothetical protein [Vibrio aestuarianus]MDE1255342.1 hypothetical protein [Vibrio aestuarianus]MDE1271999.1 hypothetical protein [Vibrio aestuarianus]MDE1294773.1 hypothetical protein [Vibrio aestuarianus]MDE1308794.1 hypothetical protein [Vibrio aestuarianus]
MSIGDKLRAILDKKSDADRSLIQIMAHRHRDFDPKELKGRKLREAVANYVESYYEQMKNQEMVILLNYEIPEISGHGAKSKLIKWG